MWTCVVHLDRVETLKMTLGRRVRGEIPICAKVGRKPTLCEKEENELLECICILAEWGYGVTTSEVQDIVGQFMEENQIGNPFTNGTPGKSWTRWV